MAVTTVRTQTTAFALPNTPALQANLVLIQPSLLYYVNHAFLMLTSIFKQNLH